MTPLRLRIVIHYFGCADDYNGGDFQPPAVREAIDEFRLVGILESTEIGKPILDHDAGRWYCSFSREPCGEWSADGTGVKCSRNNACKLRSTTAYRITDRGRAFVEALCAMPLPVQVWQMPKVE